MAPVTISAVINCYNGAEWLAGAVESVLQQTRAAFELLIVDDGSSDASAEIARSMQRQNEARLRFRVHVKAHSGLADSRNVGVDLASGSHIAFLDVDDRWERTYLEVVHKIFVDSATDIVCTNGAVVDEAGSVLRAFFPRNMRLISGSVTEPREIFSFILHATPSATAFSRKIWESIGFYDLSLSQMGLDFDWLIRSCEKGANCKQISERLVRYTVHQNNLTASSARVFDGLLRLYAILAARKNAGATDSGPCYLKQMCELLADRAPALLAIDPRESRALLDRALEVCDSPRLRLLRTLTFLGAAPFRALHALRRRVRVAFSGARR